MCTVGARKRRDAAPRLRLALGALAWPARAAARRGSRAGLSLRTARPGASSHEASATRGCRSPPRVICTVGVRKRRDAAPRLRLALGALAWPACAAARRGPRAGLSLRTDRPGASSHEALGSPPRAICTVGVRKRRDAAPRLRLALGALAWPARAAARRGPRASRHSVRHGPVRARTRLRRHEAARGFGDTRRPEASATRGRLAPACHFVRPGPVRARTRLSGVRLVPSARSA